MNNFTVSLINSAGGNTEDAKSSLGIVPNIMGTGFGVGVDIKSVHNEFPVYHAQNDQGSLRLTEGEPANWSSFSTFAEPKDNTILDSLEEDNLLDRLAKKALDLTADKLGSSTEIGINTPFSANIPVTNISTGFGVGIATNLSDRLKIEIETPLGSLEVSTKENEGTKIQVNSNSGWFLGHGSEGLYIGFGKQFADW